MVLAAASLVRNPDFEGFFGAFYIVDTGAKKYTCVEEAVIFVRAKLVCKQKLHSQVLPVDLDLIKRACVP